MKDISEACDEDLDSYLNEWLDAMLEIYSGILEDWQKYNVVQPQPNAQAEFQCNNCGRCCEFKDYWVWVYPSDISSWLKEVDKNKIIPLLLSILFPVEDMDGIISYGLPSQKMIIEKFNELIKKEAPSGIIRRTFQAIVEALKTLNPSFNDKSEFCIFYNSASPQHCTIHKYRPVQCRCYPYDYPQFTKLVIPSEIQDRYSAADEDNNPPECTSSAFTGDRTNGVKTTENDRELVTFEKCNYLACAVTQDLHEEDISDILLERYHEDVLNLVRNSFVVEKHKGLEGKTIIPVKYVAGKKPERPSNGKKPPFSNKRSS